MAERASVFQQVQLGVESVSGTSVAASKLLQSMDIIPTASVNVDVYRPQGNKFPTVAVAGHGPRQCADPGQAHVLGDRLPALQ
jgi:hypothetical protein